MVGGQARGRGVSCPSVGTTTYWQAFATFCRYEKELGGPDPHIAIANWLVKDKPLPERMWMGGCYMAVYNTPTAEILFNKWPYASMRAGAEGLEDWLERKFHQIIFRRERRAARSPAKLAACLRSYFEWMETVELDQDYEYYWESASQVKTVGRYIAIKLLEYLHRAVGIPPAPDIRPAGADWPRHTLRELFPDAIILGNSPAILKRVNGLAEEARQRLEQNFDLRLSPFELETFLCEWRQLYKSRRFYPGRPHDSELANYYKVRELWPETPSSILTARQELFPQECLGELNGWFGRREELGRTLHEHGYIHSDLHANIRNHS